MTYAELKDLCAGKSFPVAGKNEDGENVIIAHGCQHLIYEDIKLDRPYFELTTAQHNGWTRHNFVFEDGITEEFYERRI